MIGLWLVARRRWAMGLGDPKMLAMVGAFLGFRGVMVTLFFASGIGSLVGILLLLIGRARWQSKLPYGVFLALGALVALFFGPRLTDWYLGLLA
jgi:leader peptidase (prepilin peptidase)/N-methyltransferase